jgi:PPOX class probable F420-dependent enzyme
MEPRPEQEEILRGEKIGVLATLRADGSPQLTPVNYVYQDGRILVSTTRDRAKYPNVKRNAAVSLCVVRPGGRPYVTVYGNARVDEDDIAEGTAAIARSMSDRPLPEDFAELLRQQKRILIIITPERFVP